MLQFPQFVLVSGRSLWRTFELLCVAALLVLVCSPTARADTLYTYTGNDFTVVDNPGQLPGGIVALDGSMTVTTSLGSNFSGYVTPTAFSFSDGATTLTQLNAPLSNDLLFHHRLLG